MKIINTENIICTFFKKEVSEETQILFRKWFCLEEYQVEKEKCMEELWETSPSTITAQTIDELSKIKALISDKTSETTN